MGSRMGRNDWAAGSGGSLTMFGGTILDPFSWMVGCGENPASAQKSSDIRRQVKGLPSRYFYRSDFGAWRGCDIGTRGAYAARRKFPTWRAPVEAGEGNRRAVRA